MAENDENTTSQVPFGGSTSLFCVVKMGKKTGDYRNRKCSSETNISTIEREKRNIV